jgi:hypothetical protein
MSGALFIIWGVPGKKKDNYDFDVISNQKAAVNPVQQKDDFMQRLGRSLGISNFHELTDHFEMLIRQGRKQDAVDYITSNTPVDADVALRLSELFESRLRKAAKKAA